MYELLTGQRAFRGESPADTMSAPGAVALPVVQYRDTEVRMPVSVRLDERTERVIRRLAKQTGRTKSDVIRRAIATLEQLEAPASAEAPSAYERLAHLIGGAGSGGRRLSEHTGEKFRKLLEAKHRARRAR